MTARRLPYAAVFWFAVAALLMIALSGCGPREPINACKYASVRRTVYTSTITASDAWTAAGRTLTPEMVLGRQAAVIALTMLNSRCPA